MCKGDNIMSKIKAITQNLFIKNYKKNNDKNNYYLSVQRNDEDYKSFIKRVIEENKVNFDDENVRNKMIKEAEEIIKKHDEFKECENFEDFIDLFDLKCIDIFSNDEFSIILKILVSDVSYYEVYNEYLDYIIENDNFIKELTFSNDKNVRFWICYNILNNMDRRYKNFCTDIFKYDEDEYIRDLAEGGKEFLEEISKTESIYENQNISAFSSSENPFQISYILDYAKCNETSLKYAFEELKSYIDEDRCDFFDFELKDGYNYYKEYNDDNHEYY